MMTEVTSNSDWEHNCNICHCHWSSGKKAADCTNKGFSQIPIDLSNELQVIDLSKNRISKLQRAEFENANLHNTHKIYMRNCSIERVDKNTFKNLTILIELDMSQNFIRKLELGTFDHLEKLRYLVMNNNNLEMLQNRLFAKLQHLSRVEFKNNRLKTIEIDAFGSIPTLSIVYLESNMLTTLHKETFSRLERLIQLSLAHNQWNCSCELHDFRDFVISKRLYTPPTSCAEPPHLKGKSWKEITADHFACQPRIISSANTIHSEHLQNVTIPCQFEGVPRPNASWVFNKRFINRSDYRFRITDYSEENPIDHKNIFVSELRIYGVRSTDKGVYTCITENRGGRAETEFHLSVQGDYFTPLNTLSGDSVGVSNSDADTNMIQIICLIVTSLLLLLIIVVLLVCWYCKRVKSYEKDNTITSDNRLISLKMDKTLNGSILEGSVIMEMQKGLLTEINPVEKPPRRTEMEDASLGEEANDIKLNLLDDKKLGKL